RNSRLFSSRKSASTHASRRKWALSPSERHLAHRANSPIFPSVKDSEDEDIDLRHLVANLVVTDKNLPNLAGIELGHPNAESLVSRNSLCACDQLTHDPKRSSWINGAQEFM